MQIDKAKVQWDAAPAIDVKSVQWDAPKDDLPDLRTQSIMEDPMVQRTLNYDPTDAIGGQVRGAGSIGASLLSPFDALEGWIARKMGAPELAPQDRRKSMDEALQSLGVNTDSTQFKTNKLLTEIAGTAGIPVSTAKAISTGAPSLASKAPNLMSAIQSGGMTAGAKTGIGGAATRAAGGAISGGMTAGMVDPENFGVGMLIGAGTPLAVQAAGNAGKFINQKASEAFQNRLTDFNRKAPLNDTIRESVEAGYIIPPNMVKPSLKNQIIESISGKQATQQVASSKNEEVTGSLVRKALGIADDAPITSGQLESLRKTAGKAYAEVSSLSPQAAQDLEALKVARNEASGWFTAYNRSARPDDLAKAKAARALSEQLENALEAHAANAGKPELIPALRDARKQIAKTYTVGRALNDASGTVDARVLGRMYEKGLPLSDGLDVAGRFASAFPTVAKSSQQVGSQAAHNLKSFGSLLTGGGGYALMGPMGAAAAAIPFVAPPVARSLMFNSLAQRGLLQTAPTASSASELAGLLANPELQQLVLRSAPVIGSR